MKKIVLFFVILLSVRVNSQNFPSGSIEYNSYSSTVSVVCSNIKYLPDSILSLQFETLIIEKCYNLNYALLFKQLSKKKELHTLYMRDCNIKHLSRDISLIPNLKVLILNNNSLKSISQCISKLKLETILKFRRSLPFESVRLRTLRVSLTGTSCYATPHSQKAVYYHFRIES